MGGRVGGRFTWKGEFKLPWREAGPPDHHDDEVDSDQYVVNKELSLLYLGFVVWGSKSVGSRSGDHLLFVV